MQSRILAAAFCYLAAANLVWFARDTRPPFWDMANHQKWALQVYESVELHGLRGLLRTGLTEFYPPLYHGIVAVFYAAFGKSADAAQYADLPAIALLLAATYGIGRSVLPPAAAAAAAVLVNFYPFLVWLSHETLIDYWLTSLVALSIWLLIRTEDFSRRGRSILFGFSCGLGMLTKWTFPFFVALPFLRAARSNRKNAALSLVPAILLASLWYLPAIPSLIEFSRINAAGAGAEGDPPRLSGQALIFYWRALEGYQVFLPLFALFLLGAVRVARHYRPAWTPIALWLAGGWLGLLVFQNKDPRYSTPMLPAVALVTASIFEKRPAAAVWLAPLLLFQHYMVSFGIPALPPRIVLAEGTGGPLPWSWNLYTQQYFDLLGPPAHEDWRIGYVLDRVGGRGAETVRLGMVPDIPRFDWSAFELQIALDGLPVKIHRLFEVNEAALADNDFILVDESGRATYSAPNVQDIRGHIEAHPERFHLMESFSLPDGEVIRLYRLRPS